MYKICNVNHSKSFFPKSLKISKVGNNTNLLKIIVVVWKKFAAMVSNLKFRQMKNYYHILHFCAMNVWQKQFNLFVIQRQNTQISLYFVSQAVIQNERLHKLITLVASQTIPHSILYFWQTLHSVKDIFIKIILKNSCI